MAKNKNYDILDKILSDSHSHTPFGYYADLPNGGRKWIGNQSDLDEFLRECASQGGAGGYTSDNGNRYEDIERYLRS